MEWGLIVAGRKPRLGASFGIGGDQAEADPLLDEAFFVTGQFESIVSHDDPKCFVLGRTGSGKSALLHRLHELNPDKVIRIIPEDLSMPYITDLDVVEQLSALGVDLSPFWKALWRHVLIVEVIRHRYKIDSPEKKVTVLEGLKDRLGRNQGKKEALAYLEEFGSKFWAETDERVREITTSLTKKVGAAATAGVGTPPIRLGASTQSASEVTEVERRELVHKYQRVVNDSQLSRLNKMMDVLNEDVLRSSQDFTYIVIDDLDKDWVDESLRNGLILALLKTVHDLKRVKNLKVLVALRTNIFVHLDFGAANAGQEEKFRSLLLDVSWDRASLKMLLDQRVQIASSRQKADIASVTELLPHQNTRRGAALDYVLDRTFLRPRDLIAFTIECLAKSEGKSQISWDSIKRAEIPYSDNRLLALRDEWKLNYPGIGLVLEKFRNAAGRMDQGEIQSILDECVLLLADPKFDGVEWMTSASGRLLSGAPSESWTSSYLPLIRLLFDIGFLGVSFGSGHQPVFVLDDETALRTSKRVEEIRHFYVARMFHSALDIRLSGEER